MLQTETVRRKPLFTPFHANGEENFVALTARLISSGDVADRINALAKSPDNPMHTALGQIIMEDLEEKRYSGYLPFGFLPLAEQIQEYLKREYRLEPIITISEPVGNTLFLGLKGDGISIALIYSLEYEDRRHAGIDTKPVKNREEARQASEEFFKKNQRIREATKELMANLDNPQLINEPHMAEAKERGQRLADAIKNPTAKIEQLLEGFPSTTWTTESPSQYLLPPDFDIYVFVGLGDDESIQRYHLDGILLAKTGSPLYKIALHPNVSWHTALHGALDLAGIRIPILRGQ
jgi:hypothetical protein